MSLPDGFDVADARAALERALASEPFAQTPQLKEFLAYVVGRTLDGHADEIKAYTIAVDALGKREDFDPQNNATVRVMAGRLRQALVNHAVALERDGAGGLVISLPKGSYVPDFTPVPSLVEAGPGQDTPPSGAAPPEPEPSPLHLVRPAPVPADTARSGNASTDPAAVPLPRGSRRLMAAGFVSALVMVLAAVVGSWLLGLEDDAQARARAEDLRRLPSLSASVLGPAPEYPAWFSPAELADDIDTVVSRFDDYTFFGTDLLTERPRRGVAPFPGKEGPGDYHISVSVYPRGDVVRLFARLVRGSDTRTVWSRRYEVTEPGPDDPELIETLGRNFAPLGSPYGVVFSDLLRRDEPRPELRCILDGYRYFVRESPQLLDRSITCAERLVEEGSRLPSLHSMLAFLMLERASFMREDDADEAHEGDRSLGDTVRLARKAALQAREFGSQSARAHQSQFAVLRQGGFAEVAGEMGRDALALNPYDLTIVADYAAWLATQGRAREATRLMNGLSSEWSLRPSRFAFYRFLAAELAGDDPDAQTIARSIDPARSSLAAVAVAIGAHMDGDFVRARAALRELARHDRNLIENAADALVRRGFAPFVAGHVAKRLRDAGSDEVASEISTFETGRNG